MDIWRERFANQPLEKKNLMKDKNIGFFILFVLFLISQGYPGQKKNEYLVQANCQSGFTGTYGSNVLFRDSVIDCQDTRGYDSIPGNPQDFICWRKHIREYKPSEVDDCDAGFKMNEIDISFTKRRGYSYLPDPKTLHSPEEALRLERSAGEVVSYCPHRGLVIRDSNCSYRGCYISAKVWFGLNANIGDEVCGNWNRFNPQDIYSITSNTSTTVSTTVRFDSIQDAYDSVCVTE